MARPYSDDLRRKLLEAFDQGKGSLSELAEDFGVSLGWAGDKEAYRADGEAQLSSWSQAPDR
jgi:transposase